MDKVLCGECDSLMVLKTGEYGKFYGCSQYPRCNGAHGAHQASGKPLGIPGNKELKLLRRECHVVFDTWCADKEVSKDQGYKALQGSMGLSPEEAHFGRFNKEQCIKFLKIKEKIMNEKQLETKT